MGSNHSKRRQNDTVLETNSSIEYAFLDLECDSDIDEHKIQKLKDEFQNDLQMFLLNQVIFSVTFFNNYENELLELLQNESNKSLQQLNLSDDLFLTCLQPDEVFSLVNKHVYFCPRHGANKNKKSSLVTNRIFVVHENIQIVNDQENHYAHIDKPSLTAQVIEKTRPGYVKLKYIEDLKFKNSKSSNASVHSTSDEASSNGEDTGSETYGRITIARTIKPMPLDKNTISRTLYPITEVKLRNQYAESEDDLYIYEYYVDSKNVKDQFHHNWAKVAELLELDDEDVEQAGFNCDSIFCYSSKSQTMWEIIPAVQLPTGAYEKFRETKNKTKKLILNDRLTFLTNLMLNDIADMDRLAIPRGFIPKDKNDRNPQYNLQWELAHPKVERYLQNCLSHAHMKALLMLVLIHKSYIEPKTNTQGITLRHIVILLFWELQRNVVVSETRMGSRLKKMIESFYEHLSFQNLPDYFVKERNHFENIPSQKLREAQTAFKKTIDSPLLYFMSALKNLSYMNDKHPRLDLKELYQIITKNNLDIIRPRNEQNTIKNQPADWTTRRRTIIRQKHEQQGQQNLETVRKESVDSIDYTTNVNNLNAEFSWYLKARQILRFFLDHYLKMAETCHKWKNTHQSQAYIKQAKSLVHLFHQSCRTDASEYNEKIAALIRDFEETDFNRPSTTNGPELPERSSSFSIPSNRIIQKHHVNLGKVLQQHQNGETKTNLFRKRHESERSVMSDHSDNTVKDDEIVQVKVEEKPKKRPKSVEFAFEYVSEDSAKKTPKEQRKSKIIRHESAKARIIKNILKEEKPQQPEEIKEEVVPKQKEILEIKKDVNQDQGAPKLAEIEAEQQEHNDIFGFDEIISSDEDEEKAEANPNKFVNLDVDVESSFS